MEKFLLGAIVGSVITAIVYSFIKKPNGDFNNCKLENEQLKARITKYEKENEHQKSEIDRLNRAIRSEKDKYEILKDNYDMALSENLKLNKTLNKIQSE